jgi:hypothetical protein
MAAALVALDRALAVYADSVRWTRATPTSGSLPPQLYRSGIILHVGIGLRWPFAPMTVENP